MSQSTKRLPRSTRARLLAVADLLEEHPEQWDQHTYIGPADRYFPPKAVAGVGHQCGTAVCIAGWAVRLTPQSQLPSPPEEFREWWNTGRMVLGLEEDLANRLFDANATQSFGRKRLLHALRVIADIPHGKRTLEAAKAAGAFKRVAS